MNLYLKNTTLLFCIILIISMWDCKKDNPKTLTINHIVKRDIRDSLVGYYNCFRHYYNWDLNPPPFGTTTDIVTAPTVVSISKLFTDESSLVINGMTFTFYSADTIQVLYTSPGYNYLNMAAFTLRNDSIWFQNVIAFGISHETQYYYTGRKQ